MQPAELSETWVRQAQLDAERGVIECRVCRRFCGLDRTLTVWRNGTLVFAVCDACCARHDVLVRPTDGGIEIRARNRSPIVLGGSHG